MKTTRKARSVIAATTLIGSLVTGAKKSMLAAVSIAYLTLLSPADAAVIWRASDDGSNLTLTTEGSLDIGATSQSTVGNATNGEMVGVAASPPFLGFSRLYNGDGFYFIDGNDAGAWSGNDVWITGTIYTPTIAVGDSFGYSGGSLYWESSLGVSPGMITPNVSMTFSGRTVTSVFGSNLDSGPVTLWTHGTTGDTISIALVPEPSAILMLGLGSLSLAFRRSKR